MAGVFKRRDRYVLDFYDNTGKRQRVTMPKGSTRKAALEKLREIENQLEKGIYFPIKKIPLFKTVAKEWVKQKKQNIRESTWSVYSGHVDNHFEDLNNLKITSITTARIESYIADRQSESMHILTLRKVLVSLNQIMQYAVRHKYIDFNPVREAEKPRGEGKAVEKEIIVLSPDQIVSLIDAVSSQKYKTLFMVAIMTGARQGELLGLKWDDIDWKHNQIRIRRTFNNGQFFDVKTKGSRREIDLGPVTMKELKRWKLACPPSDLGLVFPNEAGGPINHNNMVNRYFRPALKDAKIPTIRFHDLRHTKASLMIEHGENLKYIQTQLGHSSPTVTLNVYAHLMNKVNSEAALRYENMVLKKSGHNLVTKSKKAHR